MLHVWNGKRYNISPSFLRVFPTWNRKQCNISLVLKSCNPSGMQSRQYCFPCSKACLPAGRMEGNKNFSQCFKSYSDSFPKLPVSHADNTLFYCRLMLAFLRLQKKTFHLYMSIKMLMLIDYYKLIKFFMHS